MANPTWQIQSGNFGHPRGELLSIDAAGVEVRAEVPAAKSTIHLRFFAFRRNRIGNLNAFAYIDDMPQTNALQHIKRGTNQQGKIMKSLSSKSTKFFAVTLAVAVNAVIFGSFEMVEYVEAARLQNVAAKAELAAKTVKLDTIVVTAHRIA
jgi:hypothetical protein